VLPSFHVLSTILTDSGARGGIFELTTEAAKIWRPSILIWRPHNLFKFHKTTKGILGKAWRWNRTSLEMLGKKAWSEARPRLVAGTATIVIAPPISER